MYAFPYRHTSWSSLNTDNPLYTDTWYNDKIRYNDNLTVTKPSLMRKNYTNYARILYLILWRNICFGYLLELCFGYLLELPQRGNSLWGNSNKYPKHMLYEEIRIKQGLSYISFCPLRILYNSKFIIMTTPLGTNAVVVTRVHCTRHSNNLCCLNT